ncbi:MAG: aldehyde dehydrogenase (NADP(+)) [Nostocoides sp.]
MNARSGEVLDGPAPTSQADVTRLARAASEAGRWLAERGRHGMATLLCRLADALDEHRQQIVAVADRETALGEARLNAELTRTCFQLRLLAEVLEEGSYLGVTIDHGGQTPMGPRPDLRMTSVPLGPVAVFGASNFPLAFSVPGGDTASALAAGCPVVAKAHDSHVSTCALVAEVFQQCLRQLGAPEGAFQVVYGREAGLQLVTDPSIAAVGFTDSLAGGRFLFDLASKRPRPIPFYGELGSVNPLVVTEAAAQERATEIGTGLGVSMCQGMGQFCTKPGLFLIPDTPSGELLLTTLVESLATVGPGHLLNDGIRTAFVSAVQESASRARVLYEGPAGDRATAPVLHEVDVRAAVDVEHSNLLEERFGPFALVVRYRTLHDVRAALEALPPALTGTVHVGREDDWLPFVTQELGKQSGRIAYNGFPTGVVVAWAMHHGGPFPASTAPAATSVGAEAVKRWLRPVSYQNAPDEAWPDELKDEPANPLPRRVDGRLVLPGATAAASVPGAETGR